MKVRLYTSTSPKNAIGPDISPLTSVGSDLSVSYERTDWCFYKDKNLYKLLMLNLNTSEPGIKICNKRKNIFVLLK